MQLYLTDVTEVYEGRQSNLYLFGRTSDRISTAIKIMDFKRHFFISPPIGYSPGTFLSAINLHVDGVVAKVEEVKRLPAVGFSPEGPKTYWRIHVNGSAKKVVTHLKSIPYGSKIVELFHHDWKATTQFLHATGIKLFTTINIAQHSMVSKRATICKVERQSHVGYIRPTSTPTSRPHVLVVALRANVDCSQIAVQHYFIGDAPYKSQIFTQPRDIFGHLRRIQPDVIMVLNDNITNTIHSVLKVAGVKGGFSKMLQNEDTFEFRDRLFLRTPGVHIVDVINEAKKMFLKPKLDLFTLNAMSIHPKLLKTPVHLSDDIKQQVETLVQLDVDTNFILGGIEISIATDLDLRRVLNNGQQVISSR